MLTDSVDLHPSVTHEQVDSRALVYSLYSYTEAPEP